jgi:O-antigen/teichoic acid export membrane protein
LFGTVFSKGSAIIANIILAILLVPEDFGEFSKYVASTVIFSSICGPWITEVYLRVKSNKKDISKLIFSLYFLSGLSSSLLLLLWFVFLDSSLSMNHIMFVCPFLISMINAYEFEYRKNSRFKYCAVAEVYQSLFNGFSAVLFAVFLGGGISLIFGFLIGLIGKLFYLIFNSNHINISFIPSIYLMKPELNNLKWSFLNKFSSTFLANIDYLLVGVLLNQHFAGLYYFIFNFSAQVLRVFSNNSTKVFYSSIIKSSNGAKVYLKSLNIHCFFVLTSSSLFCLFSKHILVLFGDSWEEAIPITSVFIMAIALRTFSAISNVSFMYFGKFKGSTILYCIYSLIFTLGLTYSITEYGWLGCIAFNCIYAMTIPFYHLYRAASLFPLNAFYIVFQYISVTFIPIMVMHFFVSELFMSENINSLPIISLFSVLIVSLSILTFYNNSKEK